MDQIFAVNAVIWIPDEANVWKEATVIKQKGNVVTALSKDSQKELNVAAKDCFLKEDDAAHSVDDMKNLSYLHEPGVVHNLTTRFHSNQIYTYTGNILIAMNPFVMIPGLYDDSLKLQYRGANLGDLAPHIFAIADSAFGAMMETGKKQSILISGESGAGKTETTKLVMEYLAKLAGGRLDDDRSIESQILESNPILEAFGNAKTSRNSNSSRFGKFIEIHFSKSGEVIGAEIKPYLLEKSRVTQTRDPERNYHCFYQLCFGASPEEAEKYKLPKVPDRARLFHYLNKSECYELGQGKESNSHMFTYTKEAMTVVGITVKEQDSIFRILSAILHLGNVDFVESAANEPLGFSSESGIDHMEIVADLLKCNQDFLEESLRCTARRIGTEYIKSNLSARVASAKRDSLAKYLYSTLFDWIVSRINETIKPKGQPFSSIGVLDIYGFEHFKKNSFEQLCINLANEKLQQHFNQHVLKMEQDEYEREKIDWTRVQFVDNQECLDLIEGKTGIIATLDSACKLESSTASTFTGQLYKQCGSHPRFIKSKGSRPIDFTLHHYAGKVKYSTEHFLPKNSDSIVFEHQLVLANSSDTFIANLFPSPVAAGSVYGRTKFVSLGNAFKTQLQSLVTSLQETTPHYVRCIKPNSANKPALVEAALIVNQLRSGGVLEAVRMCLTGYPTRKEFEEFMDRYYVLGRKSVDPNDELRDQCLSILEEVKLTDFQVGQTKIFFRAGQVAELDTLRASILNEIARKVQGRFHYYMWVKKRKATLLLQTSLRGHLARERHLSLVRTQSAVRIQRFVRAVRRRQVERRLQSAVLFCQTLVRQKKAQRRAVEGRRDQAARVIQRYWRGYRSRKPLLILRNYVRGRIDRKKFLRMKSLRAKSAVEYPSTRIRALESKIDVLNAKLSMAVSEKSQAFEELSQAKDANDKLKYVLADRDNEILVLKREIRETRESLRQAQDERAHVGGQTSPPNSHPSTSLTSGLPGVYPPAKKPSIGDSYSLPPILEPSPELNSAENDEKKKRKHSKFGEAFNKVRFIKQAATIDELSRENKEMEDKRKEAEAQLRKEVETLKQAQAEARSEAESKEKLIQDLSAKNDYLSEQLARKERLEQEIRALGNVLFEYNSRAIVSKTYDNLESLLASLTAKRMDFTHSGHSKVATALFRSMREWKIFETGDLSALNRTIEFFLAASRNGDEEVNDFCYFLNVLYSLYYLVQFSRSDSGARSSPSDGNSAGKKMSLFGRRSRDTEKEGDPHKHYTIPENVATLMFGSQLWNGVEKLYADLRELSKDRMHTELQRAVGRMSPASLRPQMGSYKQGSESFELQAPVLTRSTTFVRKQVVSYWTAMVSVIEGTLECLKYNNAPAFLLYCMAKELVYYLNVKVFNGMILKGRWCPCTYSNAEAMLVEVNTLKSRLPEVEKMVSKSLGHSVEPLANQLSHVSEATILLLMDDKQNKSVDDILRFCPSLSLSQVARICEYYSDDKYGSPRFDSLVISAIREKKEFFSQTPQLPDNKNDSSIPFNIDDVLFSAPSLDQETIASL